MIGDISSNLPTQAEGEPADQIQLAECIKYLDQAGEITCPHNTRPTLEAHTCITIFAVIFRCYIRGRIECWHLHDRTLIMIPASRF